MIHIKRGLDIPISGSPVQKIDNAQSVKSVALTGIDFIGMKPSMLVKVGDTVKIGQPLFSCKKTEGVIYTSPGSGKITEINRGDKRLFQTVVVSLDGQRSHVDFTNFKKIEAKNYTAEEAKAFLVESGLWTTLRTRPFSKVPSLSSEPSSIFVTCMDTNPLAPDAEVILEGKQKEFNEGLNALNLLTKGRVHVVRKKGARINSASDVELHDFIGPHPAGNVGTHIQFIDPVSAKKTVWHINYQDVMAIGHLFLTGKLSLERVISIAGPRVKNPRLLRTRVGANINDIVQGELESGENRIINGSILNGKTVATVFQFLGAYSQQITVIAEGGERDFLGWQMPGLKKFSITRTYLGKFLNKTFNFNTTQHGSYRAMVPVGNYEKVMPLDIFPTQLLRALVTKDTDLAQQLGCLELDEEDLALCTFVSVGKTDFGPILRENLNQIEKEG